MGAKTKPTPAKAKARKTAKKSPRKKPSEGKSPFWELRDPRGRKKIFENPEALQLRIQQYFDECAREHWERRELVKYQGASSVASVGLSRPYNMYGLANSLGVSIAYFDTALRQLTEKAEEGKATPNDEQLICVYDWAMQELKAHQIEGAMLGLYNPNIVARLNGLADSYKVKDETPIVKVEVMDAETQKNLSLLKNAGK